jgi:flagellar biosynthesis protein FlhF
VSRDVEELKGLVREIRERIAHPRPESCPEALFEEYLALTQNQVSDALAQKLIARLRERVPAAAAGNSDEVRLAIGDLVREMVHCADGITLRPGECTRVAFVGPTGVGKTTTIAKLLSIYHYRGLEVGVITNDTYRIAATEQIRRVAELVGIPVRICRCRRDAEEALEEFRSRDLVLFDTAGRSQRHEKRMEELREVLSWVTPHETHLVASVATHPEALFEILEKFAPVKYDRLVLTKLDEAVRMGLVLDVLTRVDKHLSFITTGQEIPRDIEIADADRIAALILGREPVEAAR